MPANTPTFGARTFSDGRTFGGTRSFGSTRLYELDPLTASFVSASSITNSIQIVSLDTFVKGLKANSLLSKFLVFYPFLGQTASSQSYNLINTATHPISWNGVCRHDNTGVTYVSGLAPSIPTFIPNTLLTRNNSSLGVYNRNAISDNLIFGTGAGSGGLPRFYMRITVPTCVWFCGAGSVTNGLLQPGANPITKGFMSGSSLANGTGYFNNNGGVVVDSTNIVSSGLPTENLYFFGGVAATNLGAAWCGTSFTQAETEILRSLVNTFMTAIGRQA